MGRRAAPEEGNRGRGCPRAAAPPSRGAPAARGLGVGASAPATAAATARRARQHESTRERETPRDHATSETSDERNAKIPRAGEAPRTRGFSPFKCIYNRSDGTQCEWNIACYLSCEDLGIICSLFIVLWACLLGIYTLLLKAALDTDEKDTALWIFFAFGVLFTMFVAGAVGMNQVEEALNEKYNPKEDA